MIKQKQLFRHEPDKMQYGDCHRTALACLLDMQAWECPHFIGEYERRKALGVESTEPYIWQDEQEAWLNELGYTTVDVCFDGSQPLDGLFHFMNARNPEVFYMLAGESPRGTNHSVICYGGGFEWDPHPDGGFLVGPCDNGMWEVTFVLPASMKRPL